MRTTISETDVAADSVLSGDSPDGDLVRIDRVARKLGSTEGTVRAWVARGQIPVVRLGTRAIRFSLSSDIDKWIEARKRGAK